MYNIKSILNRNDSRLDIAEEKNIELKDIIKKYKMKQKNLLKNEQSRETTLSRQKPNIGVVQRRREDYGYRKVFEKMAKFFFKFS